MRSVGLQSEGCTIVRDVLLKVAFQVEVLLDLESFMSADVLLKHIFHLFGAHTRK